MTKMKALRFVLNTYTDMPADVQERLEKMLEQLEKKAGYPVLKDITN